MYIKTLFFIRGLPGRKQKEVKRCRRSSAIRWWGVEAEMGNVRMNFRFPSFSNFVFFVCLFSILLFFSQTQWSRLKILRTHFDLKKKQQNRQRETKCNSNSNQQCEESELGVCAHFEASVLILPLKCAFERKSPRWERQLNAEVHKGGGYWGAAADGTAKCFISVQASGTIRFFSYTHYCTYSLLKSSSLKNKSLMAALDFGYALRRQVSPPRSDQG